VGVDDGDGAVVYDALAWVLGSGGARVIRDQGVRLHCFNGIVKCVGVKVLDKLVFEVVGGSWVG